MMFLWLSIRYFVGMLAAVAISDLTAAAMGVLGQNDE